MENNLQSTTPRPTIVEQLQRHRLLLVAGSVTSLAVITIVLAIFISQQGRTVPPTTAEIKFPPVSHPLVISEPAATDKPLPLQPNATAGGFDLVDNKLLQIDAKTKKQTAVSAADQKVHAFEISPDKKYLAYTINASATDETPTGLILYHVDTKQKETIVETVKDPGEYPYPKAIYNIGFSPQSNYLFYSLNAMHLYNLASKTELELVNDRDPYATAEWSKDENFVVLYTAYEGYVLKDYIYQKAGTGYKEFKLSQFATIFNITDDTDSNSFDMLGFVNGKPILIMNQNLNSSDSPAEWMGQIFTLNMTNQTATKIAEYSSITLDPDFSENFVYSSYTQITKRDEDDFIRLEGNKLSSYHIDNNWKVSEISHVLPLENSSQLYPYVIEDGSKQDFVYITQIISETKTSTVGDSICEIATGKCLNLIPAADMKLYSTDIRHIAPQGNNKFAVTLTANDDSGKTMVKVADMNYFKLYAQ